MIYRVLQENKTALTVAVMNNQIVCIKPLMEYGANPNLYSRNGWTALYIAAYHGFTSIVKELLSAYGVRQIADGTTPVHRLGIDMNIQNSVGRNALMVACMQGHLEIVKILIACGAEVNAKDNVRQSIFCPSILCYHTTTFLFPVVFSRTIGQPS